MSRQQADWEEPPVAEEEASDQRVSKSQRKRDALALTELGRALIELPDRVLEQLPMEEPLRSAIIEGRRLKHQRSALKRQIQYLGKLLRRSDPEPLLRAVEQRAKR